MPDTALLVRLRQLLFFGNAQVKGRPVFVLEDDRLLPLLVGRDPLALLKKRARGVDVLADDDEVPAGRAHCASSCPPAGWAVWSLPKKVFAQALVPRRALSLKTIGPSSIESSSP